MLSFLSDARVLRTIQNGNTDAFGILVRRHSSAVYAVAYAHVANATDAEDVVQETFAKALQAIDSVREPGSLRGWLTTIARNTARTFLRSRVRERNALDRFPASEAADGETRVLERREMVENHLDLLEDHQREILLMHYFAGLSVREIAEALEIEFEAAKKRLQRAREALGREMLQGIALPGEALDRKKLGKQIVGGLGLGALGWQGFARAAAPQLVAAIGAGSAVCAGTFVLLSAMGSTDGSGTPPPPVYTAPFVLAQAESGETDSAEDSDGAAGDEASVLKIIGSFVKRDVDLNEAKAGRLSGVTVLKDDEEAVSGVSIRVEHIGWSDREDGPVERDEWTATSDEEGHFSLSDLPLGTYGIEAHAVGLVGAESAELSQRSASGVVSIKMEPALPMGGVVQDEDGTAIEGAVVYLYTHERLGRGRPLIWDETTAMRRYTDREGRFDFEGVHTGAWTLLAKAEGYAAEISDTIQAGTMNAVIVMGKGGSVSGTVRKAEGGQPVAGATVFFRGDLERFQATATTDRDGTFTVSGLREGPYQAILVDDLLVTTPETASIDVVAEQSKSGVEILVREGGRVRGRVFDVTTKENLAAVTVDAESYGAAGLDRQAVSGDDGTFELTGLGAGAYMVSPNPPKGYRQPFGSYQNSQTTDVSLDVPFIVRDCELEPTAAIMGRVVTEEGEPVSGATVWIGGGAGTYVGSRTDSAADGFFQFEDMPRTTDLWLTATKGPLTSESTELATEKEHLLNLEVVLRTGAIVEGHVVNEAGDPVAGASVSANLIGSRNGGGHAEADGQGRFKMTGLSPGEFLIWAEVGNKPGALHGDRDTRPRVKVDFGDHITDFTLVMSEGGSIAGIVVDSEGRPLEGVTVRCSDMVETDREGRFETGGIFASHGQLMLTKEGYLRQTIPQVPVGTTDLVVTMMQTGMIRGRVIDAATGDPLPSVNLRTFSASFDTHVALSTNRMAHFQKLDLVDGAFEYSTEAMGDIVLYALADGYGVEQMPLHVAPGDSIDNLIIELSPNDPLEVVVVNDTGAPVAGAALYQGFVSATDYSGNQDKEGVTDASGRFLIATYPESGGTICAYHSDYGIGRATFSGSDPGPLTITLSNTAVLQGVITVPSGALDEISVRVQTGASDYVHQWVTATDDSGAYRIEKAPVGEWTLEVGRRYERGGSGVWVYTSPVHIRAGEENLGDVQVPLGAVTLEMDVQSFGADVSRLYVKLTQPSVVPGLSHTYFSGSGTRAQFQGVHPGPAELNITASDGLGGEVSLAPIAIEIPAEPTGPLVVGPSQP